MSANSDVHSAQQMVRAKHLTTTESSITEGLKIARDCGYGIFHIDLLLEQARVHLQRGNPQSALDDLRLALDDGIKANDETGQPELLAANHEECGYAWPSPTASNSAPKPSCRRPPRRSERTRSSPPSRTICLVPIGKRCRKALA